MAIHDGEGVFSANRGVRALIGGLAVVLSTASALVATPRVAHALAPAVGRTYVVDTGSNAITEYAIGADGNVTPIHTISGALTRLNAPQFLALDSAGNLYVTNAAPDSAQKDLLVEFAAGAEGNVEPINGIQSGSVPGSLTHLTSPQGVAVDVAGSIYVANVSEDSVVEYPPKANGNVPPLRTISGHTTLLAGPVGVTADGTGNLYVTNVKSGSNRVTVYGPTVVGDMAPTRTLAGSLTGLNAPLSVTLSADASTMYVVNNAANSVTEYSAAANGNISPTHTIIGANTGLNRPAGSAVDADGTLYVANVSSSNLASAVTEYAAGAADNVAPIRTIQGRATGLAQVSGIAATGKLQNPPALATAAAPQSTPGGGDLTDTAMLSGATTAPVAGGMITFTLFGPDDTTCSGAGVLTSSKPVTGDGSYTSAAYNAVTAGTYSWRATYSGDDNNAAAGPAACGAPSETVAVTVIPLVAALPAMSNGAYGGYVTAATIENSGSSPANVAIAYFDQAGHVVGAGDSITNLPAKGSWTVRQDNSHAFAAGGAGSALVYSTQPVASFVNEFAPRNADGTSYTGIPVPSGVGTTLYAPNIVNNAYGGYTTGIGLFNQGNAPTDVTVAYRDADGTTVKSRTLTAVPAHAYRALYSGDPTNGVPLGFVGTATITQSGSQPLAAVVNEAGPGGQNSSYDAVAATALSLNAPVALNNAFGGYFTGMGVQNTASAAGSVTITYYDATGAAAGDGHAFSIAGNGSLAVYQGSATDGPPAAQSGYTAVISSTLPLAAIVNEVAPASGSAWQSTSYNTFPTGSSVLNLPLVENGGPDPNNPVGPDPWSTGEGIMNTGTTGTTVTVTYYNVDTGAAVGTPYVSPLASKALLGLYQPDALSGLPAGSRATAVVATASGGQVAVICNESSPTTLMSYNGQ